jgi:hypothetical protein
MGSPFPLLQPAPIVVTEPRAPVLGGPRQPQPSVPFLQSSPLTLTSPPVQNPFIPVDFSKPFNVVASPPPIIQLAYSNFYPNPIPFGPYDYNISHGVIATPAREPPNWSLNINLFTNPVPFGPYDYNKPAKPPPAKEQPNWSLNINLFRNPIPFGPFDWNKPAQPYPSKQFDQQPNYPNFYPNPVPFGPFDWNKPQQPPPAREPPVWSVNTNLYTNPVPFGPFDWSKPFAVPGLPPQALPYNIVLATIIPAPPFFNPDFSKPYFLKSLPGFVQAAYGNFYPNPVPFGPFDWSRPSVVRAAPQLPAPPYNILIYSVPFAPIDFSISRPLRGAPDQIYPNLTLTAIAPTAAPFVPFDWSRPFFPQTRVDQTQQTNINIFTNPVPFGPYDYNRVQPPARAKDQPNWSININLITNPVPFGPYDYNRAVTVPAATPAHPQPYNTQLYTNPVPFALYDWSRSVTLASVPQAPLPVSIALTTIAAPVPFAQTDWSARPYFPRVPFDASRSLDLELYTNPIPFAQHDWSARPGMFPPRAPDQIYPNLPLRPTVVTVTIIQRTLTGVGL